MGNLNLSSRGGNVTVVGNGFRPMAATDRDLRKIGVLGEDEDLSVLVSNQLVSQIAAPGRFQVITAPDRIQFIPMAPEQDWELSALKGLLSLQGAVPIRAAGFNLVYQSEAEPTMQDVTLRLFPPTPSLKDWFSGDDLRSGAYYSKPLDDVVRMRIDIKPVFVPEGEALQLAFNFNQDFGGEGRVEDVHALLDKFDDIQAAAAEVAGRLK